MNVLLGFALMTSSLFAQADTVQGYVVADQVDPGRVNLALPTGRYAVRTTWCSSDYLTCVPWPGCEDIQPYTEVLVYPTEDDTWVYLSTLDAGQPTCRGYMEGQTATVPCFADIDGVCDVAQEQN